MKPGISVALLRPLSELLGKLGEDPVAFLNAVGVDESMPPNTYRDAAAVDAALAAIATRRGDPALALTLARVSAARPLGLFGHMIWLSGTLRDGLDRAVKHFAMVTQRTALELEHDAGLVRIRQVPRTREVRGRILTEFPFASLALRAREAVGPSFAIRSVRFAHAGADSPAYAAVFGAPVAFGAAHDEIELDAHVLALPLLGADPITSDILEAKVEQLAIAPEEPFLERVRRAAAAAVAEGTDPSPDDIAKALGISARTLRRHLDGQGESFRGVIDGLRRERADELLGRGMAVKEVAFALGFSEPSAFSRAYKRWTGKAPKGSDD